VTYVTGGHGNEKGIRGSKSRVNKDKESGDDDDVFLIQGITVTTTMGVEVMSMREGSMMERRGSLSAGMKKGADDFV
jgi:hypothetical protein